ncbi:hypothetical protein [Flaviaesturariibacter amylovorans]|uniref:Helix-turn-helix domain-containing protein n=1 Tax=Flaviaesturariibacter amylovorans TaxID=1084520 RepID=A0ABP8GPB6_9BACT
MSNTINTGKGLQKVATTKSRIAEIMAIPVVTREDVNRLIRPQDRDALAKHISKLGTTLKGEELERLNEQWDLLITQETKNQTWEENHRIITNAMYQHLEDYARFPSHSKLAKDTGLSRKTIAKHLKEYDKHPMYETELQKFRYYSTRVLGKVAQQATQGDMKAARLYLETVAVLSGAPRPGTVNNFTQNNFLQFNNGQAITQQALNSLPLEVQAQVQQLILNAAGAAASAGKVASHE